MARNRVIYQSEGLFVSKDASLGAKEDHEQLGRVQSANYSFTINRQDVNQFGDLARIDSLVLDPPTVSLDFSYYLADGFNERALGFFVQNSGGANTERGGGATAYSEGNFASGHLVANSGVNFFILTSPDGEDLNKAGAGQAPDSSDTVIGVGNCYISDYTVDLSVGALPTVNVTVEGANMNSVASSATTGSPAVNQEAGTSINRNIQLPNPTKDGGITGVVGNAAITALRPGDVTLDLSNVDGESLVKIDGADGAHVQSASISLPLSRTPIDRLGSRFPFAREVDFPVNATLNVSAVVNDSASQDLADILNSGAQTATITVKDSTTDSNDAIKYTMKGLRIDSQSFSSSIGSNKTVDITFSTQIGGPNDEDNGVFMSGCGATTVFQ
tara:strand:- start:911 stop:2071 length:1161 start_codon:yes stop_codon:yes gene_type:complete